MTIGQVLDVLDAHNQQQEAKAKEAEVYLKEAVQLLHWHAELCAYAFNDPKKIPTVEKSFPALFAQQGWKRQQAGFAAWVDAYNNHNRKGGGA
ncbi:hypothetical protein SDC9_120982 [bioreactor metagenome]|uniref:Uncharacterized protein n=1 Tax=bioreactor metagenome TaxID=1076179 RepID=A0A645CAP1_9ZZZZ|nr:hypothetical protein [Candidatus Pelethousia sp.]